MLRCSDGGYRWRAILTVKPFSRFVEHTSHCYAHVIIGWCVVGAVLCRRGEGNEAMSRGIIQEGWRRFSARSKAEVSEHQVATGWEGNYGRIWREGGIGWGQAAVETSTDRIGSISSLCNELSSDITAAPSLSVLGQFSLWLLISGRVQTPGHLKNPPPKKPHFYSYLILVYTLYATNNAIFYCFKAFKALSYWVFVLFYLFFPDCPKNPIKTPKNPLGWAFLKKTCVFWTLISGFTYLTPISQSIKTFV